MSSNPFRCPTCGAEQEPSDTCRRCRCDLGLLRRTLDAQERERRWTRRLLHEGRPVEALLSAHFGRLLADDPTSRRLLAVCALLCGQAPLVGHLAGEDACTSQEALSPSAVL